MPTSLAQQVAQNASLNTSILVDRTRRKPNQSYLFSGRDADQHDLESIHALAVNGFTQLSSLEPALRAYEDRLFSDTAKTVDRTLQTTAQNAELNSAIEAFLPLLGPFVMEIPTGKVIEWLVRRFRIHEFNVKAVLALFLPYHESPQFLKMLSILHISEASPYAGLLPYKTTTTLLTRTALVNIILSSTNSDLARFVAGLLPFAMQVDELRGVHRTLVAFHTGVMFDFMKRRQRGKVGKGVDEGMAAWYLSAAIEPIQTCATVEVDASREHLVKEVILSSFLLLSALSHSSPLSRPAVTTIIKSMASCAERVSPQQAIRSLVTVGAGQEDFSSMSLPKSVLKAVLKLDGLETELRDVVPYVGSENFICALSAGLIIRLADERPFNVILSLLSLSNLPSIVVTSVTSGLIAQLTSGSDDEAADTKQIVDGRIRALLVQTQQRHPLILQKCFESAMAEDSSEKEALEQALLSLSLDIPSASKVNGDGDLLVASSNADGNVRAIAVRDLYSKLASGSLEAEETNSIHSALLTRVQDTNQAVLEALYAEPVVLLPVLLARISDYVETLSKTLESAPRGLVKQHLSFVAHHVYPALSDRREWRDRIFYDVLLPFLLFCKPRQKVAITVWEILETAETNEGESGIGRYELLGGCVDTVRWQEGSLGQDDNGRSPEVFGKINMAVAGKIAENIVTSNDFQQHVDAFLSKLRSENVYIRALSYLVVRALLGSLSGEQQLNVGHRAVHAMAIESIADFREVFVGIDNVPALLEDTNLAYAVYAKPSSRNTLFRLQSSVLILPPTWLRPSGMTISWVDLSESSAGSYVELIRAVYRLANSSANAPSLSSHLMRSLFVTLADDTLSFLAGVWLEGVQESSRTILSYVALYHATAFLEAHNATQRPVDFQTVLPAILVALQHEDNRVREAALQCIAALSRLSATKKPESVYAYDAIYGPSSNVLVYLDWSDFSKYVQSLTSSADHFRNDATYLPVFHQQILSSVKTDSKKEAGFKQRLLGYILSHVNACHVLSVQVSILGSVAGVSSALKMRALLGALEALPRTASAPPLQEQYAVLLLSSVDGASVKDLNNEEGGSWKVYSDLIHHFFRVDSSSSAREAIATGLRNSIFYGLRMDRKAEVCQWFLRFGQGSMEIANESRAVLVDIIAEVAIAIQLLNALQPSADPSQRANKRSKVDSSEDSEDPLASLSMLAEILGSKNLPGSPELISSLLETLTKVVHDATAADKAFVEQVLMSALENAALSMPEGSNIPQTIRLDILVELIRVSENPQTFNQALLLMATLAKLAPNAILHNIMPIFTFMGSNVFHRDDSYSFKVVQKTIESIVPVMAASLRESHPDRLEMYIASRAFLRIFTDAANHIPRHRRTSFFTQLVDALGVSDFLSPVCMLLVDKVANRVARQSAADAQNSLFLPLSILERYPPELRLQTILESLHETRRLVSADTSSPGAVVRFLEVPPDDDSSSTVSVIRRQAVSLLSFAGHALRIMSITPEESGLSPASRIITLLLELAASKDTQTPGDDVVKLARTATENALRAMSAKDFVEGVLTVLQSSASVHEGAVELLGDQLPNVTADVRNGLTKTIVKIVEHIRKLLTAKHDAASAVACFHAVQFISDTMCFGEEGALTTIVPICLHHIRKKKCIPQALAALHSLTRKLGPRVIPHFKDCVGVCVEILRDADAMDTSEDDLPSSTIALNVMQTLLSSIPKFWSNAELLQVINLYLDDPSAEIASFMKALSKKAQLKLLLPLLSDVWTSLSSSRNKTTQLRMTAYFGFLKRCIRTSPRDIVAANLRALFNAFLSAFSVCASVPELLDAIEGDVISAFLELVVKLNEATFRPLFRKLFDWAFASGSGNDKQGLVFVHVYAALLDYFKGLMTPYMSLLLQPFLAILQKFRDEESSDEALWRAVLSTLTKTFAHDEGAFWRDDWFKQVVPPIVAQIAVAAYISALDAKSTVTDCLLALTEAVQSDATLKTINLDILMHTRSEDAKVRILALTCSETLWRAHGGKLIGFTPETATFIAEAAEDANDTVVKEAHRLKNAVESLAGNIDV